MRDHLAWETPKFNGRFIQVPLYIYIYIYIYISYIHICWFRPTPGPTRILFSLSPFSFPTTAGLPSALYLSFSITPASSTASLSTSDPYNSWPVLCPLPYVSISPASSTASLSTSDPYNRWPVLCPLPLVIHYPASSTASLSTSDPDYMERNKCYMWLKWKILYSHYNNGDWIEKQSLLFSPVSVDLYRKNWNLWDRGRT